MAQIHRVECEIGGRTLVIETGRVAKQAAGSVTVRYGDTLVLVTACASADPKEGIDFLPLTVDYLEKTFAAGKIPGGFFKREGKPTEKETLTSRFIDRPIRPLFPEGWACETQIIATVLSADNDSSWARAIEQLTAPCSRASACFRSLPKTDPVASSGQLRSKRPASVAEFSWALRTTVDEPQFSMEASRSGLY